jgi:hypothetical protein
MCCYGSNVTQVTEFIKISFGQSFYYLVGVKGNLVGDYIKKLGGIKN